jgi:hypothetical protein
VKNLKINKMKKLLITFIACGLMACTEEEKVQIVDTNGNPIDNQITPKRHDNIKAFKNSPNADNIEVLFDGYFRDGIYKLTTDSGTYIIARESSVGLAIIKE